MIRRPHMNPITIRAGRKPSRSSPATGLKMKFCLLDWTHCPAPSCGPVEQAPLPNSRREPTCRNHLGPGPRLTPRRPGSRWDRVAGTSEPGEAENPQQVPARPPAMVTPTTPGTRDHAPGRSAAQTGRIMWRTPPRGTRATPRAGSTPPCRSSGAGRRPSAELNSAGREGPARGVGRLGLKTIAVIRTKRDTFSYCFL